MGVQPWMPYSLGGRISSVCHCDLEAAYKDVQTHADAHVCLYIEVHLGVWEYIIMSNDYYYLKSSDEFTTLRALKVLGKSSRLVQTFIILKAKILLLLLLLFYFIYFFPMLDISFDEVVQL